MTFTLAMSAADEALIEAHAARENLSVPDFMLRAAMEKINAKQFHRDLNEIAAESSDPCIGIAKGAFVVPEEFDVWDAEVLEMFGRETQ